MAERLKDHLAKFPQFEVMLAYEDIDVERILKAGSNTQIVDDFGKVYQAKEHHSKWLKSIINCQNNYWADMPMTILAILSLFFIPIFQYCRDLETDVQTQESDRKAEKLILAMIWVNFILAILFGLEITMKSYGFGIRRAFSQANWVVKMEFFL